MKNVIGLESKITSKLLSSIYLSIRLDCVKRNNLIPLLVFTKLNNVNFINLITKVVFYTIKQLLTHAY